MFSIWYLSCICIDWLLAGSELNCVLYMGCKCIHKGAKPLNSAQHCSVRKEFSEILSDLSYANSNI
jgi:hypothetical protein